MWAKLTGWQKMGVGIAILLLLLTAVSIFDGPNQQQQTHGGPYRAKTFGGQQLGEDHNAWWDHDLKNFVILPPSNRSYGYTLSIEVPAGTYEVRGGCVIHLDENKNYRGDRNPVWEDTIFTAQRDIWALVEVPREVEGCQLTLSPPVE